jgi:hypothetical protein
MTKIDFQGTLTEADCKRHIAHAFDVPAHTTRVVIHMTYAPAQVNEMDNHLVLSVFDPNSARGSRHYPGELSNNARMHHIEIGAHDATYGFIPDPLQIGEWTVMIHTNMVLPDAPVQYTITVSLLSHTNTTAQPTQDATRNTQAIASHLPKPGPAWYRGDLHAHTFHSDGHWDVPDLIAAARERKLDFVTLSDHNTASALKQMRGLATPDLLTMGGIELTTFYGHALALGESVREWIDWRVSETRSMRQIAAEVETLGGTFVIAHPMTDGDPICTGCDWRYDDMLPGNARHVEVWNSGLWAESNNEAALQLFYGWLNEGHHSVATAGTDAHGPAPLEIKPGFNVVYAEELSERAILRAIRQGHLYLSTGPTLELTARNEHGDTAMMGDVLTCAHALFTVCWTGADDGDVLRVITNGEAHTLLSAHQGQHSWSVEVTVATWCVIELRDAHGQMRAITNPIFLHPSR